MANVKVKALNDFRFKGEQVKKGDEVSMPTHAARTYLNLGWVKGDAEVKEKVEAAAPQSEKSEGSPVTAKRVIKK